MAKGREQLGIARVLGAREIGCLCPLLNAEGHSEKQQGVSFSHISLSLSQTAFQLAHWHICPS